MKIDTSAASGLLAVVRRQWKDTPRVTAEAEERVYVWDLVVRATHWIIALSLVVLSVTGIYIGRPFVIGGQFVMGTMKVVHFYAAIAFTLAVLSRIVWMFVGTKHARWRSFVPTTRARLEAMVGTFLFYVFIRRRPPPTVGHNPLAGATYLVVFALYLMMIATGLGLYALGADAPMRWFEPLLALFGGAQGARWWHHVGMWLLIGFTVHHVFSAVLMAVTEKNGTLDSIFSGFKWVKPSERGER